MEKQGGGGGGLSSTTHFSVEIFRTMDFGNKNEWMREFYRTLLQKMPKGQI